MTSVQSACGAECDGLEAEVAELAEQVIEVDKEACTANFVAVGNCTQTQPNQDLAIKTTLNYCFLVGDEIRARCVEKCLDDVLAADECPRAWNGAYDLDASPAAAATATPPATCAAANRTYAAVHGARAFCAAYSEAPSASPTVSPTLVPSTSPTLAPSKSPTRQPTPQPTHDPCANCRRDSSTGHIDRRRGSRFCDPTTCFQCS